MAHASNEIRACLLLFRLYKQQLRQLYKYCQVLFGQSNSIVAGALLIETPELERFSCLRWIVCG